MAGAIVDVTTPTFESEVMEASFEMPVVVDIWAPWCGPCKALTPVLAKLAEEFGGRVKVVKVNPDENPEISQAFGVRSIPFVAAIKDGQMVDQFMGALPESKVRAFMEKLAPAPATPPADQAYEAAKQLLAAGDKTQAAEALKMTLALDPSHDAARLDFAGLLLEADAPDQALEHLKLVSAKGQEADLYKSLSAQAEAKIKAASLPSLKPLEDKVAANSKDHAARYELADGLAERARYREAMDHLLEIVMRDRAFMDDGARKRLVELFAVVAADDDLLREYRRKLATALN
jgi:putative thioredoxin